MTVGHVRGKSGFIGLGEGAANVGLGALGLVVFVGTWELIGQMEWFGPAWPALSDVFAEFGNDRIRSALRRGIVVTAWEAGIGFALGVGAAALSGTVAVLIPPIRSGLIHLAVIVYAIPIIALGPLLISIFPRQWTPVLLAALLVYFTSLLATVTGFLSVSPALDDLFNACGADRRTTFRRLQLPTALPVIVDGMKIAAPTAVLGAILGEWFGSPRGIGPILVATMQDSRHAALWATALTGVTLSLVAFGAFSVLHRSVAERYG